MNAAWIDLETTGTDETDGSILEVGLVIADADDRILHERDWLVSPDPAHMVRLAPVVAEMHRRSGLYADLQANRRLPRPADVDRQIAAYLDPYTVDGRIILAGSGVAHFDARWIRHHLPATARRLTYWTHDVGVVRRFLRTVDPTLVRPAPDKAHRGLTDAHDHLAEWRHYRAALRDLTTPNR